MDQIIVVFFFGLCYLCCSCVKEVYSQETGTNDTCKGPEACLYADIFSGYNKLTRPLKDYNKTIKVEMEFVFNALLDIEEKDEIMRVVGFFRAFWYDELLTWNPEDYDGVEAITVPAQTIWLPDIGITNSVSRFYEVTYKRDFHLQIRHTGKIRWTFGGILATSCDIDLTYYPFDHQHCGIEVESWQYKKDKLILELHAGDPVNLDDAGDDPQWVLVNATAQSYLKYGKRFSAIKFTLHWIRKPLYFYVNIIVPGAYMALITLGVFWLPIECGEKMSLGITVVLAFSVFQIVIMDITPVSSDAVPQITEMVVIVMTLATVSLLSSMFVSYLSDYDTPPPRWVKKLFLHYIPWITRMSSYELYKDEINGKIDTDLEKKGQMADASSQHLLEEDNTHLNQGFLDRKREQDSKTANGTEIKEKGAPEISGGKQIQYVALGKEESAQIKDNVKEILALLQHVKVRFAEDEDSKRIKEYWKHVGMAFDRLIFWICFIAFMCYLLYAFITVQVSQHQSQDYLIE